MPLVRRSRSTLHATIASPARPARRWRAVGLPALVCASLLGGCGESAPTLHVAGGHPERGKVAIERYGCPACHAIPGIPGYGANVGPPLAKLAARAYLGGVLPNLPQNLVRWLQDPPAVAPRTVMPNLGVTDADARDIAAYLYSTH